MSIETKRLDYKPAAWRIKLLIFLMATLLMWQLEPLEAEAMPAFFASLPGERSAAVKAVPTLPRFDAPLSFSRQMTATLPVQGGPDAGLDPATVCAAPAKTAQVPFRNSLFGRLFGAATLITRNFLPQPTLKERVNILLLGSDSRPGEKYGHTDAIILATIDPATKTAGMLSIPRDLWVSVPGFGEKRINQAYWLGQRTVDYSGGGPALAMETIEANFGVPVDAYVLINFDGFAQMVDALGGLDICVPETIDSAAFYGYQATYINEAEHYSFVPVSAVGIELVDQNGEEMLSPADEAGDEQERGYQFLYIEAGLQKIDGATALQYARSRASITSDFGRTERQRAVLLAIKDKALQVDLIAKIPELWETMNTVVETDLELADLLQLARTAQDISSADIQTAAIGPEQTSDYVTNTGAQVLLPKWAEIDVLVSEMFGELHSKDTEDSEAAQTQTEQD